MRRETFPDHPPPITRLPRQIESDQASDAHTARSSIADVLTLSVKASTGSDAPHRPQAIITSDQEGAERWRILRAEQEVDERAQTAPSGLMYLVCGQSIALLNHIATTAELLGFELDEVRLSQRFRFTATRPFGPTDPRQFLGGCDDVETRIDVTCRDDTADYAEFAEWCLRACLSLSKTQGEMRRPTRLYLNGAAIVPGGKAAPTHPNRQDRRHP